MSLLIKHFYQFGMFTVDCDQRILLNDRKPVALTPKVFDTLLILVENKGRLVEKEDLMKRLWPDTFVEESNLTFNIKQLRKALADDARHPTYIETVARRGYRFIANVEEFLTDEESYDTQQRFDTPQSRVVASAPPVAPLQSVQSPVGSSSRFPLHKVGTRKFQLLGGLLILLGITVTLSYVIYRAARSRTGTEHFQIAKFTRVTVVGTAHAAAISPDGKFVSYAVNENGQSSLWTKAIATGSAVQIVPPTDVGILTTTFSPDGDYVYYVVSYKDFRTVLYRIPVLGGKPTQLNADVGYEVSFSPDGRQFTYVRYSPDLTETQLYIGTTEGDQRHVIASIPKSVGFSHGPSWSPDGTMIGVGLAGTVVGVSIASGEIRPLTQKHWDAVGRVIWFKSGTGLAVVAIDQGEDKPQIWHVDLPSGQTRRITNDLIAYDDLSLSATSNDKSLVTVQQQNGSSIWVVPDGNAVHAHPLIARTNSYDGIDGLAWTPDGRIVYTSLLTGHLNLWMADSDGSNSHQLTDSSATDSRPCVSPDGRYVVFTSNRAGTGDLWRMDTNGNNEKQITFGDRVASPTFSPDGRWVVYQRYQDGHKADLWRVATDGGNPVRLTNTGFAVYPTVSPDGRLIAYYRFDVQDRKTKIDIIPFEGGAAIKTLEFTFDPMPWLRWSPDGRYLIYNDTKHGVGNLWRLPVDNGVPQQMTDFKSDHIWYFNFTPDGKQLAVARGNVTTDVVLVSDSE